MRISEGFRTLAVAGVALLLAACGAGGGERDIRDTIHVETLQVKLRALASDACHSDPGTREPWQCEKYVTQLANAATTISAAAETGFPQLAEPGRRMKAAIDEYHSADCTRQSADEAECVAALERLADAVSTATRALGS